jgi:predicted enzyme related to lactoylglutathione lyase
MINQSTKENSAMSDLMGPDFITLQVRDLEASRRFYGEVIGFKISPEVRPNAVAFATQPISFAIRKSQVDLDAVPQLGYGVILWFRTDDAVALHKQLKARGVSIVQDLADSPFGKTFTFHDPDGYLITVHDGG